MKPIVESLQRLYSCGKVTENKINEMYQKGTINENDKIYILRKEENNVHNTN